MNLEELLNRKNQLIAKSSKTLENMDQIANESIRVANLAHNSRGILQSLEKEFEEQTGLNGIDITFLFFATALQCVRQYLLTDFKERVSHDKVADKVKGGTKESSNRSHRWYLPSAEEIATNPVPYDAIYGSQDFRLGFNGNSHRYRTLGHDPLLGWIFGTANITTSTLTTWDLCSYHVKTGYIATGAQRDKIANIARTEKVLSYTFDRLMNDGIEGKIAVATALLKQWKHIKSDKYSKAGLPIPVISAISPDFAQKLASYGIDLGNVETVGKQAAMAIFINIIIAMLHGMFYDEKKYQSWSLYEVKTRKILSYSNLIASTSNIIYVASSVYYGNKEAARKLDIGGLIVTIYRLINDTNFIQQIKEEFVFGGFNKMIQGSEYNF